MDNISKLVLTILSTFVATSLLAQCPGGGPCPYQQGGNTSGGSYSYDQPQYGGGFSGSSRPNFPRGRSSYYSNQSSNYPSFDSSMSQPYYDGQPMYHDGHPMQYDQGQMMGPGQHEICMSTLCLIPMINREVTRLTMELQHMVVT